MLERKEKSSSKQKGWCQIRASNMRKSGQTKKATSAESMLEFRWRTNTHRHSQTHTLSMKAKPPRGNSMRSSLCRVADDLLRVPIITSAGLNLYAIQLQWCLKSTSTFNQRRAQVHASPLGLLNTKKLLNERERSLFCRLKVWKVPSCWVGWLQPRY